MEIIFRSRNEKLRRYAVFFLGLFIMSFGVSLEGVREGTVIVAVLTGPVVKLLLPHLRWIERREKRPTAIAQNADTTENEAAAEKLAKINSLRRDHYSYFTEKTWGDLRNYAAVYDTSRLSPDAVVRSVIALYIK